MNKLFIMVILFLLPFKSMSQIFSLNTNMIFPLDSELEISVSKKYTVSPGVTILPFGRYSIGSVRILGRRYIKESFVGPFISAGGGFATYYMDPVKGKAECVLFGVGYNFILKKRLSIKAEVGAGLFFAKDGYTKRVEDPWKPDIKYSYERFLILPYPLSVSICYIF